MKKNLFWPPGKGPISIVKVLISNQNEITIWGPFQLNSIDLASHGAGKPGLYIAGASGWVLSALPPLPQANGPSWSSARPLYSFHCRSAGNHIASQGLKGTGSPQEPQAPGQPHTSDQATGRPLGQPYSHYQAPDASGHAPGTHPARPGWPSPLAGRPGSVCTQAWRQRCRSPWWPPLWLAGRAQLEACMLACPGASSTSVTGAPGTYKGEFGAAEVSSKLGAELTTAPWRSPRNFVASTRTRTGSLPDKHVLTDLLISRALVPANSPK